MVLFLDKEVNLAYGSLTQNIIGFLIILTVVYFKDYLKTVKLGWSLLGPFPLPLIGNALLLNDSKKLVDLGYNSVKRHGKIFTIWISLLPVFFITQPKDLQVLLSSKAYCNKSFFYKYLHNFLGQGLITNSGDVWKYHRKCIQPLFHINILEQFIEVFGKYSQDFIKQFNDGHETNVTGAINLFVLKVLHKTVLGVNNINDSPFHSGKITMIYRLTRPWMLFESFFKMSQTAQAESSQKLSMTSYVAQIAETKKNVDSEPCFFDMLLSIAENNPKNFSKQDAISEACTFMLAGQDSVSSTLAFALYCIAKDPDVQQKIQSELNETFDGDNRIPTLTDLNNMKYLEQCIKETMRMYPSVPIMSRQINEELTLGGVKFPAGTNFFISPFITHHLESYFKNPKQFDPERFSAKNAEKINPYAYLPFSLGPRNCIGYKFAILELKTVLSMLLRDYKISLVPGHEKINLVYRVTLRKRGGVWIQFEKR